MARPAVRRIPPPRGLLIDSPADLQSLRESLSRRRGLPRVRITLRLDRLRSAQSDEHERALNRLLGTSPFWAALAAAVVLVAAVLLFPVDPAGADSPAGVVAWIGETLLAAALGWFIGRVLHQAITRWRIARRCRQIEAEIAR